MVTEVTARDFNALEKRVSTLESRLDRIRDETNRALGDAKGFDDRIDSKVGDLEKRLRRDIKGLVTEKDFREQIDKQLLGNVYEMEKSIESRTKSVDSALSKINASITSGKSQDEKLEKMIAELHAKIERLSRGS